MYRCTASSLLWLLTLLASTTGALDKPDISWGDWIIIDDHGAQGDSGASILLRRITPKSVFVAPNFNNCPEGYRQDDLGRCVKIVQVNKQAQWSFFLQKLNSMYAPTPSQGGKESGPFHINLPIGGGSGAGVKETPETVRHTTPVSTTLFDTDIPSTQEDLITTIKVDRDTTKIEQETSTNKTTFEETTTTGTTLDQENINSTTTLDQNITTDVETTTIKIDQDNLESTVNMKEIENQTESNLPESQTKRREIEKDNVEQEEVSESVKKPFIIVVAGQPDLDTTTVVTTTGAEFVSEPSVTTDVTEQDNSESVTVEPIKVKLPYSVKSKCDLSVQVSRARDEPGSNIDCEPVRDTPPLLALPQSAVEPDSQIRFPSESSSPVRKATSFVRFPEDGRLWENTRQNFRWPLTWEYQQHPDIMAWPPVDKPATAYHHYNPRSSIHHTQTWSNSPPWQRRLIQRD